MNFGARAKRSLNKDDEGREKSLGMGKRRHASQAELNGEPVMQGSPKAFHPSLGLRGRSRDLTDAKFVEDGSKLA